MIGQGVDTTRGSIKFDQIGGRRQVAEEIVTSATGIGGGENPINPPVVIIITPDVDPYAGKATFAGIL